jgi:hypothetical protein
MRCGVAVGRSGRMSHEEDEDEEEVCGLTKRLSCRRGCCAEL